MAREVMAPASANGAHRSVVEDALDAVPAEGVPARQRRRLEEHLVTDLIQQLASIVAFRCAGMDV